MEQSEFYSLILDGVSRQRSQKADRVATATGNVGSVATATQIAKDLGIFIESAHHKEYLDNPVVETIFLIARYPHSEDSKLRDVVRMLKAWEYYQKSQKVDWAARYGVVHGPRKPSAYRM